MMITVVVPVFNEEKYIKKVLEKIPKKYNIIVVNDGSKDNTAKIVKQLHIQCINLERNMGKGYACRVGAKNSKGDIIFIDGDAQFDPREIPKLVNALKSHDLVIGARKLTTIPWPRKLSNFLSRKIINYITGYEISDPLSGFRAIKRKKFFELKLNSNGYEFELEMILKFKGNIYEVPVNVRYDIGSRMPITSSIKLTLYLMKCLIKSLFKF